MNMDFKRKLPIPMEIKEQFPLSYQLEQLKVKRDVEIKSMNYDLTVGADNHKFVYYLIEYVFMLGYRFPFT